MLAPGARLKWQVLMGGVKFANCRKRYRSRGLPAVASSLQNNDNMKSVIDARFVASAMSRSAAAAPIHVVNAEQPRTVGAMTSKLIGQRFR